MTTNLNPDSRILLTTVTQEGFASYRGTWIERDIDRINLPTSISQAGVAYSLAYSLVRRPQTNALWLQIVISDSSGRRVRDREIIEGFLSDETDPQEDDLTRLNRIIGSAVIHVPEYNITAQLWRFIAPQLRRGAIDWDLDFPNVLGQRSYPGIYASLQLSGMQDETSVDNRIPVADGTNGAATTSSYIVTEFDRVDSDGTTQASEPSGLAPESTENFPNRRSIFYPSTLQEITSEIKAEVLERTINVGILNNDGDVLLPAQDRMIVQIRDTNNFVSPNSQFNTIRDARFRILDLEFSVQEMIILPKGGVVASLEREV